MKIAISHIYVKIETRVFFSDDIFNCYYRTESVDGLFGPSKRENPNSCLFKGNVIVEKGNCYFTSNGGETTIENLDSRPKVRYYDIDLENNRALTEFGWCSFSFENNGPKWMNDLNRDLHINQINIPGTHDSGTYAIDENSIPGIDAFRD